MSKKLKSRAVNSIGYTGIVTLSQYVNGKKFTVAKLHNEGGKSLFNFLASCLIGDFKTVQYDVPTKILLLNEDDQGNLTKAANSPGFITRRTKPELVYSTAAEGIVRYSFTIPQEYFAGATRARFNGIGLYADSASNVDLDLQNYAAYCKVDTSNWELSFSSVLLIDWELHISN